MERQKLIIEGNAVYELDEKCMLIKELYSNSGKRAEKQEETKQGEQQDRQ